jgi:transposase
MSLSPSDFATVPQKAKPRLKSLESWLREKMKTLSRHSELTKAFAYALNQRLALTYLSNHTKK